MLKCKVHLKGRMHMKPGVNPAHMLQACCLYVAGTESLVNAVVHMLKSLSVTPAGEMMQQDAVALLSMLLSMHRYLAASSRVGALGQCSSQNPLQPTYATCLLSGCCRY